MTSPCDTRMNIWRLFDFPNASFHASCRAMTELFIGRLKEICLEHLSFFKKILFSSQSSRNLSNWQNQNCIPNCNTDSNTTEYTQPITDKGSHIRQITGKCFRHQEVVFTIISSTPNHRRIVY